MELGQMGARRDDARLSGADLVPSIIWHDDKMTKLPAEPQALKAPGMLAAASGRASEQPSEREAPRWLAPADEEINILRPAESGDSKLFAK